MRDRKKERKIERKKERKGQGAGRLNARHAMSKDLIRTSIVLIPMSSSLHKHL